MSNNNVYLIGDELPLGFLSSPQIEYCLKKYKILEDADVKNIKAGVYAMRLGDYATRWESGIKLEFKLDQYSDEKTFKKIENIIPRCNIDVFHKKHSMHYLELPPNSLTFVTTIEQFNLAQNLIARFNLKSSWIHKGLLLGTGPIVDPGFQSKIAIPLHNFSNKYVYIEYGEQLINVEFTITHNPNATSINGIKVTALNNDKKDKPVSEYFKAADYVESSISSNIYNIKKSINLIKGVGFVAIGAAIVSFITLLFYVLDVAKDASVQVSSIRTYMESVKKEIKSDDINEIATLKKELNILSAQVHVLQYSNVNINEINTLNKRVMELELKIEKYLERISNKPKDRSLP